MNGYQPKTTCNSCTKRNDCKKYKENKNSCKLYEGEMPKTPKNWTPPAFRKPTPPPAPKPTKQRTVLSVRDFSILYDIASRKLAEIEANIATLGVDREEANHNPYYQDLLRIREKLGELNIEVETPIVEVEE